MEKTKIFKGQNLIDFAECFNNDQDCRKYLSTIKWSEQYVCRKCSHSKSQIRKDYARTCNICSDTESAMSNTLFHKVKFGLRKAFFFGLRMQGDYHALPRDPSLVTCLKLSGKWLEEFGFFVDSQVSIIIKAGC